MNQLSSFILRISPAVLAIALAFSACTNAETDDLTRFVDPFIGTDAHGHTFPGAVLPFGMVQVSPDNGRSGWDWCSGYHWSDSVIVGFSHKHLSGTGIGDLADILFQPTTRVLQPGEYVGGKDFAHRFAASFSHQEERASPGYYQVTLRNPETLQDPVGVELTATRRAGFHRYRFPAGKPASVVLDLGFAINWDAPQETFIRIENDTLITGYRFSKGWADDQRVWFAAVFSKPMTAARLYRTGLEIPNAHTLSGKYIEGIFSFGDQGGELLMKVGISPVDENGALQNLLTEIPHWKFDKTRREARETWNRELSKVSVTGTDKAAKRTFYTAMYHSFIAPALFSDSDGRYRGIDRKVHQATGWENYTVFSLWDTFRANHPLFTILQPERVPDMIQAMLAHHNEGGLLPVWTLEGCETNCMIGYHAVPVIVDAALKGFEFDHERAYEAMKKSAMQDAHGIGYYREYGYIPADLENESVSKTLEYAFDDWCIAQMAHKLGRDEDYHYYMERSGSYLALFDPVTRFMRGKLSDGSWKPGFNPLFSRHRDDEYTEGNAWQYSWFVPHQVEHLIRLMGGKASFTAKLDSLFSHTEGIAGDEVSPDISGLIGQYAHGNEPSHHVAYLYALAGAPERTQELVNQIRTTLYSDQPDGLCGNEDCGQMSAWYIFSAMGFYPLNPASGDYVLGTPAFDKMVLNLTDGVKFTIRANRNSESAWRVKSVLLNGEPHEQPFISHAEIMRGGELLFIME